MNTDLRIDCRAGSPNPALSARCLDAQEAGFGEPALQP